MISPSDLAKLTELEKPYADHDWKAKFDQQARLNCSLVEQNAKLIELNRDLEASAYQRGLDADNPTWRLLHDPDGFLTVSEGETYLFAVNCHMEGYPMCWEYFSDAIVWDSETEPQWADGGHGWALDDVTHYRALPDPPSAGNGG